MALDEIRNRVEEVDGVQRIYCVNHSDPRCGNGNDELGWGEPEWVMAASWLRVGDHLACSPYCAARAAGHDEDTAEEYRAAAVVDDPITEEAVAAMHTAASPASFDVDALEHFGGGEG